MDDETEGVDPCPVCDSRQGCEHELASDIDLDAFADGLPARLVGRLDFLEDDQLAVLGTAPPPLRALFAVVAPNEALEFANNTYWTEDPDVIASSYDAGYPGGSGVVYYHPDGPAFTARVRQEAAEAIIWLDEHLPQLGGRTEEDS